MNRDEQEFANKIKGYLDESVRELKPGTLYRLQQARSRALDALARSRSVAQTLHAPALAGLPGSAWSSGKTPWRSARLWIGVVLIAATGFGYQQWLAYHRTSEMAELDALILASDLPIDAYLDKGFQTWLTRQEQ